MMSNKVELKKVELLSGSCLNTHSLKVTYTTETLRDIQEDVFILALEFSNRPIASFSACNDTRQLDLGFGALPVVDHKMYRMEKPAKELTVKEIEEKLGYKIKIVGGTRDA